MMDPDLKAKWVAALRSGKYKQTRQCLKDECGYCCLGVLADIINPDGWVKNNWLDGFEDRNAYLGSHILPPEIQSALMRLNDGSFSEPGITLAEIADIIESNEVI